MKKINMKKSVSTLSVMTILGTSIMTGVAPVLASEYEEVMPVSNTANDDGYMNAVTLPELIDGGYIDAETLPELIDGYMPAVTLPEQITDEYIPGVTLPSTLTREELKSLINKIDVIEVSVGNSVVNGFNTTLKNADGDDIILVPLRAVNDELGITTTWDAENQVITMTTNDRLVNMQIGTDSYIIADNNENLRPMVAPTFLGCGPTLIDGTTYVPLSLYSNLEVGNDLVNYNDDGTVNIYQIPELY